MGALLDALASREPAPAGGSAAAAVVAIAAALLEKVAQLSPQWEGSEGARSAANRLRLRSEELIERDAHAYVAYVEARRARRGVEGAASAIVDVPLQIERAALDVVELSHELAAHGNRNLRPDATTAAVLAHAAISAAAMMVQVNLGASLRDARLQEALKVMRDASESVRRLGALGLVGDRGRA